MKKLRINILLLLIGVPLLGLAQNKLPNRKVIVYTQYEAVGPRYSYRDYSLVKRITIATGIPKDKREKIEAVVKEKAKKEATQNMSLYEMILWPDDYAAIVRVKYKSIDDIVYHRFKYWKYKTEDELKKKLEDLKYWAYQSHEIVYQEASLTSMGKDTDDYYNQMLDYFKSIFEKEEPESKKLIEDFKEGYTGIRG